MPLLLSQPLQVSPQPAPLVLNLKIRSDYQFQALLSRLISRRLIIQGNLINSGIDHLEAHHLKMVSVLLWVGGSQVWSASWAARHLKMKIAIAKSYRARSVVGRTSKRGRMQARLYWFAKSAWLLSNKTIRWCTIHIGCISRCFETAWVVVLVLD